MDVTHLINLFVEGKEHCWSSDTDETALAGIEDIRREVD